jgi:glycosyltransferase involved in cell wall biosynthesis
MTPAPAARRIAYLSQSVIPSRDANSVHVMKMCDALASVGCDVTLVACRGSEDAGLSVHEFYGTSTRVNLELVPKRTSVVSRTLSSAIAAVRVRRRGIAAAVGRDLAGCYAAALLGLPVSYETHEPSTQVTGMKRLIFHRLVKHPKFRRLIVITRTLEADYRRRFNIPADRILVAPDAASEPAPSIAPLTGRGALAIGYVGQLYQGKGMEIIGPLAERCAWADFHVVGGRDEDVEFWRARYGSLKNLHFYGFVPHRSTDAYRNAVDVLLAPFQPRITIAGEGDIAGWTSPLKLFEYMAAGKPILCSDLPVLREVMRDAENCLLLPPDDLDAWSAALARLRDDSDLRARLGRCARADFLEHYTWNARAARVLASFA